ncbi:MAG TPA: TIGR03620 family F420-dependent LLM class oxidoreductase [Streptosporangiaceae bacterium]|jgi:probable F420-dependent oxidoreductase|nr:TIGR03620 family F420-dependent LLM class oxidoreductase [Streptosporangiaceae bacterium]
MTKLDLGSFGVVLNVAADGAHRTEAAELEALGYGTIWLPGGQLDRLDRMAEIAEAAKSAQVASAIIPIDVYEPGAVSQLYAQLEASAPGRFAVGLGGPQRARPLAALNAYLDRLDVPASRLILAALGPRKLELARDRAAGAILLLVTPDYVRAARALLGDRATLVVDMMVVLDADAGRARETARAPLRFLSGVPGYRASFARMGFSEPEVETLDDRLVDELVLWGDPATVTGRLAEFRAAGADHIALHVLNGPGQPPPLAAAGQLAPLLRS